MITCTLYSVNVLLKLFCLSVLIWFESLGESASMDVMDDRRHMSLCQKCFSEVAVASSWRKVSRSATFIIYTYLVRSANRLY